MDFLEGIQSLFDLVSSYITLLQSMIESIGSTAVIAYLYITCIPEEIRIFITLVIILLLFIGYFRSFTKL